MSTDELGFRQAAKCIGFSPLLLALVVVPTAFQRVLHAQTKCGECSGGVSQLTLKYNGAAALGVRIVQRSNDDVVFDAPVNPGQQFTINGTDSGTFGDFLDIFVNDALHAFLDTNCSPPIGPGLVRGDFEVIDGLSEDGGPLCPAPPCDSSDPTNTASCYADRSDRELRRLLFGTASKPFSAPVVCGLVVSSPGAARGTLEGSACRSLRREGLTLIFNIRRSILFGDGLLGNDGAVCFGVSPFEIELRCGGVFVPDPETPDPGDALVVTEETPISVLVEAASRLCELADCPASDDPCESTVRRLRTIIREINESRSMEGGCKICPGDETGPPITCPRGVLTVECEGPDGARVNYGVTAVDDCDPEPTITCTPPSGSLFPLGPPQTVECVATDIRGNSCPCSFEVEVVDTAAPSIQCPADITVECSAAGAVPVNFTVTASDLCDPNPIVTCTPASGQLFPPGATQVTCTARDNAGNESSCSFMVTVGDTRPPTIDCPGNFERECIQGGTALVEYPPPSVMDDCDPAPAVVCQPPSGSRLPPGVHRIGCTATDSAGNSASCEFMVTVVDRTNPVLVCPADMRAECRSPQGAVVKYALPVANDACDGQPRVDCVPPPGSTFQLGNTEVACTSTDRAGNTTRCTFTVTVVDTTSPTLVCPQPIRAECSAPAGTRVDYTATASDLCDLAPRLTCEPPSGSLFPMGQTMVDCSATDMSGNRGQCSFSVTVADGTPPSLVCPPDMMAQCTTAGEPPHKPPGWPPGNNPPPNPCTAIVEYPLPEASDACQQGAIQVTCSPASGTRLELGMHTVTCRARDAGGNEAVCTFVIDVVRGENAFIRGDANADGDINIADAVYILNNLFLGGPEPPCADAGDVNDNGEYLMDDAVFMINYQFMAGRRPPDPFLPTCGLDTTADNLGCERYRPCE